MSEGRGPAAVSHSDKWSEGDFTLISADGIGFKMSSPVLLWTSDVLAGASGLACSTGKVLQLTDPDIEHAAVVDRFLDLAVNATLEIAPTFRSREVELSKELIALVHFLHKYQCTTLWRQFYLSCAENLLRDTISPRVVFVVACEANDSELCRIALNKICSNSDSRHKGKHECRADPGQLPLGLWDLLSHEHAWAYCVAFKRSGAIRDHCNGMGHAHSIGSEFVEVLKKLPLYRRVYRPA